jgi:hypothetical protein
MKCWSCNAENDLQAVQTCAVCGAPLVKGDGVFSKSTLLLVLLACLFLQVVCVVSRVASR